MYGNGKCQIQDQVTLDEGRWGMIWVTEDPERSKLIFSLIKLGSSHILIIIFYTCLFARLLYFVVKTNFKAGSWVGWL
jgi:hypothetical protein